MGKPIVGTGNLCANGTLVNGGLQKDGLCPLCKRKVGLKKDGRVKRHVWEPKDGNAKSRSVNSDANRAQRAFLNRGRR